ncbi:glycoside hydrolase family 2 protein [Streptomyces caniscabiei]|uniref:Glycoside hydrolase family 2 TIM barrel-domain containing protein n=1 Tax=Streptomyces caniscabiei TaxID=2746961 RepID=A0ABU4N273_9ACTN|nr:glycoside hydrolase family 2 TIM barrel-domain containing protein [Streptomyces caniscabiei]MBE4741807.1 beta galactosidase jelly roll domain-containing protein [Streptomyces caniscabiei]MBE4762523.1 beta galactosidase jelly roll domain-containing protein [Streptomyces caniscabiei]MBE4775714.1 beta galactosidase jelly roll domain-containing protein [Streptomyces caniscabiei]MBE4790614.1 beta galactosidase jelly roll domain-containing protein [Streptomyces caniscabiei]MBE4799823.1 beta galac
MTGLPSRRQVLGGAAAGALASLAGIPLAGSASAAVTYTAPDPRVWIQLNTGWRFIRSDATGAQAPGFDDSSWTSVTTPHTWNAVDGADGGNNYYRGVGWYRRHYTVPSTLAGKRLYLQFAGVNQVADVWVNGTYLGQHKGGYSRFRFDATGVLVPGGDNVIAVKVTNARDTNIAPVGADYTFQGGIYRNVSLWAVEDLHVRMTDYAGPGVYLRQSDVTAASATVTVTTKMWNDGNTTRSVVVRTVIADKSGTVVAETSSTAQTVPAATGREFQQTLRIDNPHLWNGVADPYLHNASVEIHDVTGGGDRITDVVTERLGLRSLAVDADTGFRLNGSHLHLHGVNLHQDRAVKGWAISDADHTQDFDLIGEIGANAVRMAHYQHDQKDYNLADERGMVVWAEIPLVDIVTDSTAFTTSTQNQLRELIRQNYNHPSIAFWGIGNEQLDYNGTATNRLLASLADIVEAEDPDRLSTYAVRGEDPDNAQAGLHTQTTGFNKYYGWYYGSKDNDLGAWADNLHANAPSRRIAMSEYGVGASTTQHALNPPKPAPGGSWHPEEYQSLFHEAAWKQLASRPYIWGTFVWAMFDFPSDGRNEGGQPGINDKGLVTRDRQTRKDAFHWYKANWADTPTLYITSRRWTQRTDAATELKVYSNASQVTATLNGTSLGTLTSNDHIFKWPNITLRPGQNTVTVTATINGTTYTDTVSWTLG